MKTFPDVDYSKWYGEYIKKATECGLMVGDDKGNFRPNEALTRAEAATLAVRLYEMIKKPNAHRKPTN